MAKKEDVYKEVFWDFCKSFDGSNIKEEHGIAGDGVSPYHIMTCNLEKPKKMQIQFSQGGLEKEIHLTNFSMKKRWKDFIIKDNDLNDVILEGEPTDRTFITRDLGNPQLHQGHQMSGEFDKIELRFHGGNYGRMYWIEAKRK